MNIDINHLLDYTDWERMNWQRWFKQQGERALEISTGPHVERPGQTVRDLVRHIFLVEKFYAAWLKGEARPDPTSLNADTLESLFEFGRQERSEIRTWLSGLPAEQEDRPRSLDLGKIHMAASPRKAMAHLLVHEVRHWGQVATLLRLNGFKDSTLHDLIASPVMGGEWKVDP